MNIETKLEVLRQLVYLTQTYADNSFKDVTQRARAIATHDRAMTLIDEMQSSGEDVPQDPEMRAMGKDLDIAKRALDCLAGGEFATVEDTIKWAQGALGDIEGPKDRPVLPKEERIAPIPNPIIRDGVAYPKEEPVTPGEAVLMPQSVEKAACDILRMLQGRWTMTPCECHSDSRGRTLCSWSSCQRYRTLLLIVSLRNELEGKGPPYTTESDMVKAITKEA